MVIYYVLAFDRKFLNMKNIIGTKTELCIYLHLSGNMHVLTAQCYVPGTLMTSKQVLYSKERKSFTLDCATAFSDSVQAFSKN